MQEIILKYLNGEANEKEISQLEEWLQNKDNQEIYKKSVRLQGRMNQYYLKPDKAAARRNIEQRITKQSPRTGGVVYLWKNLARIAAVFAVVALGAVGYYLSSPGNELVLPEDQIIVKNGSGKIYSLDEVMPDSIYNAEGSLVAASGAGKLSYDPQSLNQISETEDEQFIRVPRGKRLEVDLADGSRVFMNSDSELRFSSALVNRGKREVHLTGEAYFDVAHKDGMPFIVHTGEMSVEVLGTEFDVKNYRDDEMASVVLVDGKVAVSATDKLDKEKAFELVPGMRASLNKAVSGSQIVLDEVDTSGFTSWMNGEYRFRDTSLSDIIKVLERTYNVDIELGQDDIAARRYNATIRSDDIYKTLEYFKYTLQMEYSINGNKIIFE